MNTMRLVVPALVACGLTATFVSGAERPAGAAVMEYLGQRAVRLGADLPAIPHDRAAWEQRRAVVRGQLAEVLGLPPREPMRAATQATRSEGDLLVEDVAFLWAERAYVAAQVVRPARVPPAGDAPPLLPALVMPPGWLGQLKEEVYRTFVHHMAREGYLVLFIDDPHVGQRVAPYAGLYGAASAAGTQVMGIQVFDTLRGLDYLLTRPDVDPERIGVAGLCQGSEQTWLAAALEDRFQIAVPVCGTTTYEEWVRMPITVPTDLSDPSPYVAGVLRSTDWHEIGACIAPRPVFVASNSGDNWWPVPGYDKVVTTLERAFQMYDQPDRFRHLRDLRSHSITPFIPELAPWIDSHLRQLPAAHDRAPQSCEPPADPDFSMLHYCQRRIARQTDAMPQSFADASAWRSYRQALLQWLGEACALKELQPAAVVSESRELADGVVKETVQLSAAPGLSIPALVMWAESGGASSQPTVVLSHDSHQCMTDPAVLQVAGALARDGYLICIPEHVSVHPRSRRRLPHLISLYGAGDTVGLPPLALRVWGDLCAVRYVRERAGQDQPSTAVVGLGIGSVDAAMAAALDPQIAACAVVGAITVRDWAEQVAPNWHTFDRLMPYLPELTTRSDLQYIIAAIAPRPLLLLDAQDRAHWPECAFQRVAGLAEHVYMLEDARGAIRTGSATSPDGLDELRPWLPLARRQP